MRYLSLAALLLVSTAAAASAQGKAAPQSEGQDVLFFSKNGPVLLRIQVEVDGKSINDLYRDHFKKVVAYFDRNGDSMLDANEVKYLPGTTVLANLMRQGLPFFQPGYVLKMADLGKADGEKATLDDFMNLMQKLGLKAYAQVANFNNFTQKSAASTALFKLLDANGDGLLSKEELLAAPKLLKKYDLNGDELLSAQEILGGGNPNAPVQPIKLPKGNKGVPIGASPFHLVNPSNLGQMASQIISRYDANKDYKLDLNEIGLDQATFKKLDRDSDGFLTMSEVMHWTEVVPAVTFMVRFGKMGKQEAVSLLTPVDNLPKSVKLGTTEGGLSHLLLDHEKVSFHLVPPTKLPQQNKMEGLAGIYYQAFNQARKDKDFVEKKDLTAPNYTFLLGVFDMFDRNGDGKVTEAEIDEYVQLLEGGKFAYASVQLAEESQDLFQILDTNRDGKLSMRELMNASKVLSGLNANKEGITEDVSVHQYVLAIGLGQMFFNPGFNQNGQPQPVNAGKKGPLWFQKMDVNGDGDVSPSEFLGPKELFQKMDLNHDGLIDAEEAWKANEWFAKKNK